MHGEMDFNWCTYSRLRRLQGFIDISVKKCISDCKTNVLSRFVSRSSKGIRFIYFNIIHLEGTHHCLGKQGRLLKLALRRLFPIWLISCNTWVAYKSRAQAGGVTGLGSKDEALWWRGCWNSGSDWKKTEEAKDWRRDRHLPCEWWLTGTVDVRSCTWWPIGKRRIYRCTFWGELKKPDA